VFELYKEIHGKTDRYKLDGKRERALRARIKEGRTDEEFARAFRGVLRSGFHVDGGHTDLELICRDAPHFDRFLAMSEPAPAPAWVPEKIGPTPEQLAPYLEAARESEPTWTPEDQAGLARERWEWAQKHEARVKAGVRL
jgi:hypothetical protein